MEETKDKPKRLLSLDVFRGITIAGMILVNNHGPDATPYAPLRHADWHGWTPTDLVFPFFVFIMGVSMAFSFARRTESGHSKRNFLRHIVKRSVILFVLGLLWNFDIMKLPYWRIMGVLQRLALVYLFASLIVLYTRRRGQAISAAALLALYWALMKLVPVPGFGAGDLSREGNLAGYIDNLLLKGYLYTPTWDPEGLLHTIPAIAGGLIGCLVGHWIRSDKGITEKISGLAVAGNIFIVAGLILHSWFPINKNLWSPSYVIFISGLAMNFLAV
ncbi:MAG: DUF5009 domain-containing protein, partial [bacterium]